MHLGARDRGQKLYRLEKKKEPAKRRRELAGIKMRERKNRDVGHGEKTERVTRRTECGKKRERERETSKRHTLQTMRARARCFSLSLFLLRSSYDLCLFFIISLFLSFARHLSCSFFSFLYRSPHRHVHTLACILVSLTHSLPLSPFCFPVSLSLFLPRFVLVFPSIAHAREIQPR